jgi:hypothetical protein
MEDQRFDWDASGNLTPMGQVESYGRFARGAARFRRPSRQPSRWVWVVVALVVVASVVLIVAGVLAA